MYCFFLKHLMLYFAEANIIIKGGKQYAVNIFFLRYVHQDVFSKKRKEHNPPHFHVIYGEYTGEIEIKSLKMLEGDLPPKALELVKEWAALHQTALMHIWETQEFIKLPPLK